MGTKVQHKSFPGYSSMMDLNEDADSSWSRNYEDKMLGGHFYNGFAWRPENGYSEYDREMLKRTMLEHEAIFRKQVYELHRLYRIQKDLMDDFQQKGLYRCSVPRNASQSNSFSSPIPPEYTKMIWRMPQLPGPSNGYNGVPFTGTNDMRPLSNSLKENSEQPCHFPIENESLRKDSDVQDFKPNKFPRKMFDLQLPADVYIDNEDTDNKGKEPIGNSSFRCTVPSQKHYCAEFQNDVKLTLGTGECSDLLQDRGKLNSHKHWLDPNKSNGEILHEIGLDSPSPHFLCPKTGPQENQVHLFPLKSTTSFLGPQSALSKHRHCDEGSFSKYPFADKGEIREAWTFNNNEDGESRTNVSHFGSGLCNGKLPISFDPMQFKSIESHQAHSFNKAEAWLTPKPSLGIEVSGKSSCVGIMNNPGPAVSGTSCSFAVPYLDYTCTTSALVSVPKQGNNISHMASTLSCFSECATMNKQTKRSFTATQDSGNVSDRWRYNGDLRPCLRIDSEGTSNADGFGHPYQLGSSSARFGKLNLKVDCSSLNNSEGYDPQKRFKGLHGTNVMSSIDGSVNQALQNGIRDGLTKQDKGISKCDISSEKISWFSSKPASNDYVKLNKYVSQMDLSFSQGYLQLIPKTSASGPKLEWKQEQEKNLSTSNIQDLPSTSRIENRMQLNGANDSMRSTKILGFPILDRIQKNVICSPSHQEQFAIDDNSSREKVGSNYIDLCTDINVPSLENQIPEGDLVRTNISRIRNHINLNSTCMENPSSTELSPEGVVEVPSRFTLPNLAPKVVPEIDLEAPVTFQAEEEICPSKGYMPSDRTDCFQEKECSHEALVKEAAESIIRMSLDRGSSIDDRCSSLSAAPSDTLQWFAEVVSSNTGHSRVLGKEDGCCEFSDDGLDHFELMTLKLEELKADDYQCKPWEPINQEEELKDNASLLLSKPRRGQARRRRQRDFQKDILPGLASLSRQEVTEDLQTIGGLMKASGKAWQPKFTRRNAGRNGLNSQSRGRRRPRNSAITVAETDAIPPQPQPTQAESVADGMPMIGWGRTTRRCRRQRCLPVSVTALT